MSADVPKINCGRRGLPEAWAARMYNDYLRLRSLRAVGKIYGRSSQALWEMFTRRGWRTFEKIQRELIEHNGRKFTPGKNGYMRATAGDRAPLHAVIWTEANGPLPAGHVVMFKDNDKRNFALSNLACMPLRDVVKLKATGANGYTKARVEQRIEANMGFITQRARYYADRYGTAMEDLIAAGRRAIAKADQFYRSDKGANFLTYAAFWIRREMTRTVAQETGAIRTPANLYHRAGEINARAMRLDAPASEEGDTTLGELFLLSADDVAAGADHDERAEIVAEVVAGLAEDERELVRALFWERKSQRDVAAELGVTHQAVSQRFKKIARKLRFRMRGADLKEAA